MIQSEEKYYQRGKTIDRRKRNYSERYEKRYSGGKAKKKPSAPHPEQQFGNSTKQGLNVDDQHQRSQRRRGPHRENEDP